MYLKKERGYELFENPAQAGTTYDSYLGSQLPLTQPQTRVLLFPKLTSCFLASNVWSVMAHYSQISKWNSRSSLGSILNIFSVTSSLSLSQKNVFSFSAKHPHLFIYMYYEHFLCIVLTWIYIKYILILASHVLSLMEGAVSHSSYMYVFIIYPPY